MSDDLKFTRWTGADKAVLWGIVILCVLNLLIGLLTLGPDILKW
jgi:hypothetical protein